MTELCQKDSGTNWKNSQSPNLEQFEQQNYVMLDYNPNYKIISMCLYLNKWLDRHTSYAESQIFYVAPIPL